MAATRGTDSQEQLKSDFRNFLYVLWHWLPDIQKDPTPVQYDIAHFLQHGPRRRMVKAFRGVGKSWMTAAYVLWLLLRNHEERILVVSASKERADAFTIFCRRLITEFPPVQHLKPRKGQRDSVISFDVGPSSPAQSPSLRSAGITGQITGSRATVIVADDVETPSNSLTQMLRDRLGEAVKEFDAVLVPGGHILYLGTDQTELSLYKKLPERGYEVRVWPARVPKADKVEHYGSTLAPYVHDRIAAGARPLEPLDPDRFNEQDLIEREASYGRSGFALQFMLDPSLSDAERYPLKCLDLIVMDLDPKVAPYRVIYGSEKDQTIEGLECPGLAGDRFVRPMATSKDDWADYQRTIMFVDPSGRGRDETSYAVLRYCLGKLYLAAAGGCPGGYDTMSLGKLLRVAREHAVQEVYVEPNFGDGMFRTLLEPVFAKGIRDDSGTIIERPHPCSVEDAPWAKSQKEARIIDTLEPVLMQHRLVVDRKVITEDLQASPKCQLFYQLTRVTRERGCLVHDDRLDALAGAVSMMLELMTTSEEDAAEAEHEKALDEELQSFLDSALGRSSRGPMWNSFR